ncbi:hypothetical protein HK100_012491 [Physocladia obscura]|uniref:DUF962 domain-containing protein n=1 Tax=Physocladia obscura TaxID=109957 RepID=A0AAD5SZS9_9FUNG|nr:hypothetical protein HK100_012491 [Physocladia obscura]
MAIGVGLFNFKAQYVRYAEYHSNKTNQAIHTVFVPTILWTSLVIAGVYDIRLLYSGAAAYATYYAVLHPVLGGSAAVLVGGLAYSAAKFVQNGVSWTQAVSLTPLTFAAGLHVTAWIFQFIGHGVFERRAPALLDNPVQALVLAPFFIWSHLLFELGFFKELDQELRSETEKRVAAFRAKSDAGAAAGVGAEAATAKKN